MAYPPRTAAPDAFSLAVRTEDLQPPTDGLNYAAIADSLTPEETDYLGTIDPTTLDDPTYQGNPLFQSIISKLQAPAWATTPAPAPAPPPDPRIPRGGALDTVKALQLDHPQTWSGEALGPEQPDPLRPDPNAARQAPDIGLMGLLETVGGLTGSPAGKFAGSLWDQPGNLPAALGAAGQEFATRLGEAPLPLTREEREARRTSVSKETETRFGPQPGGFLIDLATDPANYIGGSPLDLLFAAPKVAAAGMALSPRILAKIAEKFPVFASVLGETVAGGGKLTRLGSLTRPSPPAVVSQIDSLQAFRDLQREGKPGAFARAYKKLTPDQADAATFLTHGEALGATPADIAAFYVKQHGTKAEHVLPAARDFVQHLQQEGRPIHAGLWHDVMDGLPAGYTRIGSHFVPDATVPGYLKTEKAAQAAARKAARPGATTARHAQLEAMATDEAMGVEFPEDEPSHFPNGDDAVVCTNCATRIIEMNGGEGEIYGWADGTNPTSVIAGPTKGARADLGQGHDFAVIDKRYLVDAWAKNVEMSAPRAVFDLDNPADQAEVRRLFGDPKTWVRAHMEDGVPKGFAPGHPAQFDAPSRLLTPAGRPVGEDAASRLVGADGRPASAPRIVYTPAQLSEGHLRLAPAAQNAAGDVRLSTRIPWAVDAAPPATRAPLTTDLATVLEAGPEVVKKMADEMRQHPLLTAKEARGTDAQVLERVVEKMKDNLLWLWDRPEVQELSPITREWYVGAQVRAYEDAPIIRVTPEQVAASIAALSPKKDWHENAELARRFGYVWRDLTDVNAPFDRQVFDHYQASYLEGREGSVFWQTATPAQRRKDIKMAKDQLARERQKFVGVHFADLPRDGRARMIRAYAEVAFPTEFNLIRPTGEYGPQAINADGTAGKLGWGLSQPTLIKALRALEDPRIANISQVVGEAHKVRSFYNNIIDPRWAGAVTIDTHAIAAAHLLPLSLDHREVKYAMGGIGDAMTGITGGNPIYAEAYNRAAQARGVLPREMQSVTWEALRGLFTPEQKSDKVFVDQVRAMWDNYKQKGGDINTLRQKILDFARPDTGGRIKPPDWTVGEPLKDVKP